MNNIEELKKAALGANLHGWTGFEDALNADGYSEAVSKFIGHCSPSEILALIAQLEAAQKERDDLREKVNQADSEWHKMADRILSAGKRAEKAEAQLIKAEKGEVLVTVSGFTGCGKSAVAGEIEIALLAIGVPVRWTNGDAEKRMTGADYLTALEMYKPHVRIVERNIAGGKWYE